MSDSAEHNTRTINDMQGTGRHAHTQQSTQTQGAMERNQANSGHTQRRAPSPEPSTATQTPPMPSSSEDQGTPEAVRLYGQHQLFVPRIIDALRAECSMSMSGPATAACNREERVQRTTTPERTQNTSQHTAYSDYAAEYSANAT